MVYLVGGYKLTEDQVLQWCRPRNIDPPKYQVAGTIDRWLSSQKIPIRLLPCDYEQKCIFLVVTDRRVDPKGTINDFEPFQESERARNIKDRLEIDDVEFVTVPNPYGVRRLFSMPYCYS